MTDVTVENHGTIFLFHLHTDAAREFVAEFVEAPTRWGDAIVVEHGYAAALADGMVGDGLEVE